MKWLVGEITTGCNDKLIKYELDKVSFGELASCQGGKLTRSEVEKNFNFMKWQTDIMTSYRNFMLTNCQFGKCHLMKWQGDKMTRYHNTKLMKQQVGKIPIW
jgi:hypothetical protein